MNTDLYTALAKANETIKNPSKDGSGNYGAYLTLDALLEAVRAPLAAQGISVVQDVTDDDERVYVTTRLVHASGQEIQFGPMSSPRGQNIQHAGAATTYLRRFTLGAALGVAGEADDDGQSHADQVKNPPRTSTPNPRGLSGPAARTLTGPASDKQIGMLKGVMRDQHLTEYHLNDYAKDQLGFELDPVKGLNGLTKGQASSLIEALTAVKGGITRTSTPDPDDPWAAPLVDPATGEVAR